ncbi:MAG: hypothetical protein MZV70_73025 [Desulfobacterales bacterium]|nr:hypothetical protein [Desulfobacterales bacterium]
MVPEAHDANTADGLLKKRPLYRAREFSGIEELDEVTLFMDRLEAMAGITGTSGLGGPDLDLADTEYGGGPRHGEHHPRLPRPSMPSARRQGSVPSAGTSSWAFSPRRPVPRRGS